MTSLGRLIAELDAAVVAEDEHAPHVVVVVDDQLGPGPAAGPFGGALEALVAADRLETALNNANLGGPVRTQVVRLFNPHR